jgi:hypothetical protein
VHVKTALDGVYSLTELKGVPPACDIPQTPICIVLPTDEKVEMIICVNSGIKFLLLHQLF